MLRKNITPRNNWQYKLERLGFDYHSLDGRYWVEDAGYCFFAKEIDVIEEATNELHAMCLNLVADIVQQGHYEPFGLSKTAIELIETSWRQQHPSLYGRFDFVYRGNEAGKNNANVPKLLEYNADTPTALFEASVVQWYWLQDHFGDADQFNSIHEHLIAKWQSIANIANNKQDNQSKKDDDGKKNPTITFATITDSIEDTVTCRYLQDTAMQAGLPTTFMDLRALGWQSQVTGLAPDAGCFVNEASHKISHLFKLYPWEWLLTEPFAEHLPYSDLQWLEPIWKVLLSNKAILPLLWEKYPNHPNLLPSYFEHDKHRFANHDTPYGITKKPVFSREGANISLLDADLQTVKLATQGEYASNNGGWIYQTTCPLPKFHSQLGKAVYPIIGSWVIGQTAAGMGVREDDSPITKDTSHFVPHYFYP